MKKFKYKGKELTFKEILPFSVVPEKTLHNRLYSSTSIWSVKNAIETPFGKVGKTPEISKHTVDVNENKHNKKSLKAASTENKIDSTERGHLRDEFICCGCGHLKSIKLCSKKVINNKYNYCLNCTDYAETMANRTEQELKIAQSKYKSAGKKYKAGKGPLFFITNEEKYKKKK